MPAFDAKTFVRNHLDGARPLGKANELSWLDFKLQWPPMKDEEGRLEFLKDAVALANTGQDALMVVGVDDKGWTFKDQRIADSGYTDGSQFASLVASRVTPAFSVEVDGMEYVDGGNKRLLSLVHITPTRNRPHLIGEWTMKGRPAGAGGAGAPPRTFKNALFFRRGARTFGPTCDEAPTRAELDAMYLDRPGTFTNLRVQRWHERHLEYAKRSDPVVGREREMLSVPIIITNCSAIATGFASIRMKGRIYYVGAAQGVAGSVLLPQPTRSAFAVYPSRGDLRLPQSLAPAESVHLLCHFLLPVEYWAIPSVDARGCHRLEATIEVDDIHGTTHYLTTTFDDVEPR